MNKLNIPFDEFIKMDTVLINPLYKLISWFVASNNLSIFTINIIAASIFSYGLVYFCKQTKRPWLTLLVSMPYLVMVVAMGYNKQSIAIGILLIGFGKICNNESNKFIYYCLAASLFHITSLIVSPIILLTADYKKINKIKSILAILTFALVTIFTLNSSFDKYIYGYVDNIYKAEGSYIRFYMTIVPTIFFLLFRKRLVKNKSEILFLNSTSILSLILGIIFFLLESTVILDRLLLYIIPIQMYVIGNFADFKIFNFSKKVITFSIFIYCICIQYFWLSNANHAACWIPYKNILLPF